MSMLEVQNLSVRFGSAVIVNDVSFSVQDGDWLMLIGPNGAGKSTIVNAVSRRVPYTGTVFFEGKDVQKTPAHLLARGMGVLAQHHTVGYAFSVEEVVRLGRYAYAPGIFSRRSDEDERSVAEAMELTGVAHIARQSVLTLSGGELQRVFLAQLFAQNPRLLLLDEPTNHLDLVYHTSTIGYRYSRLSTVKITVNNVPCFTFLFITAAPPLMLSFYSELMRSLLQ